MSDVQATQRQPIRLTDFANLTENQRWRMVNDNVMGGRSLGRVQFDDGVMIFSGSINTNGGGFSSVRMPLEPGTLKDASQIRLRVRSDGRSPYRLLIIDNLPTRPRTILHRHDLPLDPNVAANRWQTVTINLDQLTPSFHGNPVSVPPLSKDHAVQLGFILNDTGDGPFRLEVDWIEVVR
ncbi:CIA30 family protein [Mucisphaera sp.]|uniref:CIA30 family protein n=1 Tax=Mucisphaera sp. TaxID=2913024 RepID=UPI003D0DF7B4